MARLNHASRHQQPHSAGEAMKLAPIVADLHGGDRVVGESRGGVRMANFQQF